jgi:hypothetical protein
MWSSDIHKAQLNRIERKLDRLLYLFKKETEIMSVDITALTAEVANNTAVDASVIQLVQNLVAEITTISGNSTDGATQTALNALVATLQNNDAQIAAAVVANTPAASGATGPTGATGGATGSTAGSTGATGPTGS